MRKKAAHLKDDEDLLFLKKPMMMVDIPGLHYSDSGNFLLVAGPCVVESEKITFQIAKRLKNI